MQVKILNDKLVEDAKQFAIVSHWGQMYGKRPYIYHLEEVANICRKFELPPYVVAAGYLHDILEDTDVDLVQVNSKFGYEIATLVHAVTDMEGETRKEKKEKTYPKIMSHPYGVHLKIADRIANVSACSTAKDTSQFDKYCKEAYTFEKRLYIPGVAIEMWDELNGLYGSYKENK